MRALLLSTHPGPAAAVTLVGLGLAVGAGLEPWRVVVLTLAVLTGQASIGFSNDWLDAARDTLVQRRDKPVAAGLISARTVRAAAFVALALSLALSASLGAAALATNIIFLGSAWSYNLGLKKTAFSAVPYIVSFGLLPVLATTSLPQPQFAAWWAIAAGALLGVAAHFANVLPDLADDAKTGVRGLPHRVGVRVSGVVLGVAIVAASAALLVGSDRVQQWVGLAIAAGLGVGAAASALVRAPGRGVFRAVMVGALLDVCVLALAGPAVLA